MCKNCISVSKPSVGNCANEFYIDKPMDTDNKELREDHNKEARRINVLTSYSNVTSSLIRVLPDAKYLKAQDKQDIRNQLTKIIKEIK